MSTPRQYLLKTVVTSQNAVALASMQAAFANMLVLSGEDFNVFDPIELNTARIEQVRAHAKEQHSSDVFNIDDDAVLSEGEDGPWIQCWLFIPKEELEDDADLSADQLEDKYNPNPNGVGQHPMYRRDTWRAAVGTQETISGYWDWVEYQIELKES